MDPDSSPVLLGYALHQRCLDRDPVAAAQVCELYLPILLEKVARRWPNTPDPHAVETAVHDALMNYIEHPSRYDPTRLTLLSYLVMSAKGDVANSEAARRTRAGREISLMQRVAELADESEEEIELQADDDVEATVLAQDSETLRRLVELFPSPIDLYVVELMLEGVRRTESYAIVLQITRQSPVEQERTVKKTKDRIRAKIRRNMDPDAVRAEARGHV